MSDNLKQIQLINKELNDIKLINQELHDIVLKQKSQLNDFCLNNELCFNDIKESKQIINKIYSDKKNSKFYNLLFYSSIPLTYLLLPKALVLYPLFLYML